MNREPDERRWLCLWSAGMVGLLFALHLTNVALGRSLERRACAPNPAEGRPGC